MSLNTYLTLILLTSFCNIFSMNPSGNTLHKIGESSDLWQGLTAQDFDDYEETSTKDAKIQVDRLFTRSFSSNNGKTEQKLIGLIQRETQAIDACIYEFNAYNIAYALCKMRMKGIPIRLIMNSECAKTVALLLMERCGIAIKFCKPEPPFVKLSGGIMHKKVFLFDANRGKAVLFDTDTEKDRSIIENDKDLAIPLYWDGSFNPTGAASKKNIESTTVVSDEVSYPARKTEFRSLWNNKALCFKKKLDPSEIENHDNATINSIPQNAFNLLLSTFFIDQKAYRIGPHQIVTHKDFVPHDWRMNARYADMKSIVPDRVRLPFPCYFSVNSENEFLICGKNQCAYKTKDLLTLNQWLFEDKRGRFYSLHDIKTKNLPGTIMLTGPYKYTGESDVNCFLPYLSLMGIAPKLHQFQLQDLRDNPFALILQEYNSTG